MESQPTGPTSTGPAPRASTHQGLGSAAHHEAVHRQRHPRRRHVATRNVLNGFAWVAVYLFFCLAPLLLAAGQQRPTGRPFLVEFSIALGFVGLSILALQFALIARFKPVAAPFGIDVLLKYHVQITFVGLAFVLAHPVLLFIADSKYLELLNLVTAPWRARFAVTSVIALVALIVVSMWRRGLRLSYELWHATHGLLAVAVVLLALLHASLVGYYVTGLLRHVIYDGYIGALTRCFHGGIVGRACQVAERCP